MWKLKRKASKRAVIYSLTAALALGAIAKKARIESSLAKSAQPPVHLGL